MANHKRKANYKASRSCGLCKPWKRVGNRKSRNEGKKVTNVKQELAAMF